MFEKFPNLLFALQGLTGLPRFSIACHYEYAHNYYQVQFVSGRVKNKQFRGFMGKFYRKNEESLHQKKVEEGGE